MPRPPGEPSGMVFPAREPGRNQTAGAPGRPGRWSVRTRLLAVVIPPVLVAVGAAGYALRVVSGPDAVVLVLTASMLLVSLLLFLLIGAVTLPILRLAGAVRALLEKEESARPETSTGEGETALLREAVNSLLDALSQGKNAPHLEGLGPQGRLKSLEGLGPQREAHAVPAGGKGDNLLAEALADSDAGRANRRAGQQPNGFAEEDLVVNPAALQKPGVMNACATAASSGQERAPTAALSDDAACANLAPGRGQAGPAALGELSERQSKGVAYLRENGQMSRAQYQAVVGTHVPSRTAQYDLRDLVERGLIAVKGKGPATRYVLVPGVSLGRVSQDDR